ncbi:hypothetical protein J2A69_06935 [Burkholderia pseudomallei]|nr:hypothetical protein BURPSS13_P1307 [Burkholderia pseudomallei S13]MBF3498040.1 hypothetical protein [Burkholderia pseudomallei]MBF3899382.1 hypothetical protein [Burkholderia pseudomallei]MBF3942067.1 hypothetical protein [Burkholderia pseudomallei]MBO2961138.1 hypothetical protein [Burkholderia pseudomallei]
MIARLGGVLGGKGDGESGANAVWLGLKEVHLAASLWRCYASAVTPRIVYKSMH